MIKRFGDEPSHHKFSDRNSLLHFYTTNVSILTDSVLLLILHVHVNFLCFITFLSSHPFCYRVIYFPYFHSSVLSSFTSLTHPSSFMHFHTLLISFRYMFHSSSTFYPYMHSFVILLLLSCPLPSLLSSSLHPFLIPHSTQSFLLSLFHPSLLSSSPNIIPSFRSFLPLLVCCHHSLIPYIIHPLFSIFALFLLTSSFPPAAHHLSPQALKWREYRRKNPLGVEKNRDVCSSSPCSSSSLSASAALTARRRTVRRNVFDFPPSNQALNFSRLNGAEPHLFSIRGHLSTF